MKNEKSKPMGDTRPNIQLGMTEVEFEGALHRSGWGGRPCMYVAILTFVPENGGMPSGKGDGFRGLYVPVPDPMVDERCLIVEIRNVDGKKVVTNYRFMEKRPTDNSQLYDLLLEGGKKGQRG